MGRIPSAVTHSVVLFDDEAAGAQGSASDGLTTLPVLPGELDDSQRRDGMSDQNQGPGWWVASDGKWYPPEQAPAAAPIPPPPPSAVPVPTAGSTGRNLMLVGAGAITIGSLLPWASVTTFLGTVSKAGTDGDGIITLGLGVLFGIWAFMNLAPRARIVAGCVVALIALYDIVDVMSTADDDLAVSVGIGLWIVAAGGVLAIVGSVQARR